MNNSSTKWNRRISVAFFTGVGILLLFAVYSALSDNAGKVFSDFCYPYWRLSRFSVDRISDQSLLAYDRGELVSKLEHLQRENQRLALQAKMVDDLLQDNHELRRLSGLQGGTEWEFVPVEIVLRDPLFWRERFTIDRGSADRIREGAALLDVTPDGRPVLIGLVDRVGKRTSTVATLYNSELRISVRFGKSGAIGFLNAGESKRFSDGRIPVGYLPAYPVYQPGEAVSTTGFERGVPGGILVGEVAGVDNADSVFSDLLLLNGSLKPAADFSRLRFLAVACRKSNP